MNLRERLVAATLGTVLITAILVAAASNLWRGHPFLPLFQAAATLVATGLGGLFAYHGLVVPTERQLSDLANRLRLWEGDTVRRPPHDPDPDLASLDDAVFEVIDRIEASSVELRQRTHLLTEMIHTSHVGIALLDTEGVFTLVNDRFRGMFRLRGEPVGRKPLEVVASVDIHLAVEDALTQGTGRRAFTTESSDLVATADALSDGVFLRVEDVTGRREAERARTDFVANVSHELRTPLTAILGYLETVLQDEERIPDDIVQLLQVVDRNTRRLRDLFEDLLRLHRIESRRRELPMERMALRPILLEATGPAQDRARMRDQAFTLTCPEDLQARVNPDALSAIVGNLAGNASTYTPDGGTVRVVAERVPGGVRIQVVDDGIGIPRAHHERIFERFYRVDAARSRREGSTGLGLAIVKHYALACGFQIGIESEEGEGSTFSVLLPASAAPTQPVPAQPTPAD